MQNLIVDSCVTQSVKGIALLRKTRARPILRVSTHATPSAKRRKGRVILPENDLDGQPLTLRDSAEDSPLFMFERDVTTSFDEVEENPGGLACAIAMAEIANDTKGEDITVLHVAPLVSWTSYMVFVTVFSKPQLEAILGKLLVDAVEKWDRQVQQGGRSSRSEWELLDLGDVVIHVFTERERAHYDLEQFYSAAERVQLSFSTSEGAKPDARSTPVTADGSQGTWSKEM